MRLELTRWLRLHWDDMSAGERAKLREADAVSRSRRRGHHEHARGLSAVARDPHGSDGMRAADRLRERVQPDARARHGASATDGIEDRARRATTPCGQGALIESLCTVAGGRRRGRASRSRLQERADPAEVFPQAPGMAGVPIDAWPSHPSCCSRAVSRWRRDSLLASLQPGWPLDRSDGCASRHQSLHSTQRLTAASHTHRAVKQRSRWCCCATGGLLTGALHDLEHQDFGFDRRSAGGTHQSVAGWIPPRAADAPVRSNPGNGVARSRRLGRGALHLLAIRRELLGDWRPGGWAPGPWAE